MRVRISLILVLALTLLFALAQRQASAQNVIQGPSQYHTFNQVTSIRAPTVTKSSGQIVATFAATGVDNNNDIFIAKSPDALTWSDPQQIVTEVSPHYVSDVKSASVAGTTYVTYTDKTFSDPTGQVMMTSCDDTGHCAPPSPLGPIKGDGSPEIAVTENTCPTPRAADINVLWSDYSDSVSGQGDAFFSTFKVGDQPPAQPIDLGPSDAAPRVTSTPNVTWTAEAKNGQVIVNLNGAQYVSFPASAPIQHVWLTSNGNEFVQVWWQTSEVPPRTYYSATQQWQAGGCDRNPPQFSTPAQVMPIANPVGDPSFASGIGGTVHGQSSSFEAVPEGSGQGLEVFSWIAACCQGKFELMNSVSTDGGQTWSDAKAVTPPSDQMFGQSVAVLGNTIWNIVNNVVPGETVVDNQNNLEVAASADSGATYTAFNLTNDNISLIPMPFFLSSSGEAYSASVASQAPLVSPPIVLTWFHNGTDLAVAPLALIGDSTCDNVVDVKDVIATLREVGGLGPAPCELGTDSNCNHQADVDDAFRDLRFAAGLPVSPLLGCEPVGT